MQIIPKANTLRKSVLLYRGIRYRRGYGVHSPFVFNLITKVIEERCSYYSFYDIELIRKQLLFRDDSITYPDRQQKGKPDDVGVRLSAYRIVRTVGIYRYVYRA